MYGRVIWLQLSKPLTAFAKALNNLTKKKTHWGDCITIVKKPEKTLFLSCCCCCCCFFFSCIAACSFDLEHGIDAWKRTGTVFNNQPTFGDNPTARKRGQPSNHQGDWWIGGYENRSSKAAEAGAFQGDTPKGTLTSPRFRIIGKKVSFLIGGGCRMNVIRAELLVKNGVRS